MEGLLGMLSAFGESEHDLSILDIQKSFDAMEDLKDHELAFLLSSKQGMSKMKECVLVEDPTFRAVYIIRTGRLIIRVWMILHGDTDLEGYLHLDSRSESRRIIEDFMDMAVDFMKNCSCGVNGKSPESDPSQFFQEHCLCSNAYCEVLTLLLDSFNQSFEELDSWYESLAGINCNNSKFIHNSKRSKAASLIALIQPVLAICFEDRNSVILRLCKPNPSYSNKAVRLVSSFIRLVLSEVPGTCCDSLTVIDSSVALTSSDNSSSIFDSGNDVDSTSESRASKRSLPVQQYASEWVNNYLLYILQHSTVVEEVCCVVKDLIMITQHQIMRSLCQYHVYFLVLQKLFYLLENPQIMNHCAHSAYPSTTELISWSLLLLRYIDPADSYCSVDDCSKRNSNCISNNDNNMASTEDATSVSYAYYLRLLKIIVEYVSTDSDIITQTRFFTEFSVLVIHRVMNDEVGIRLHSSEEWERYSASRSQHRFPPTLLTTLIRSSLVRTLIEAGYRSSHSNVLSRFITALCQTFFRVLQHAVFPLLEYWPSVQAAVTEEKSTIHDLSVKEEVEKITVDISQYSLDSYVSGQRESQHPWALFHDELCIGTINSICCKLHDALYSTKKNNIDDGQHLRKLCKYYYSVLVRLVANLIENAVFLIRTFETCFKWPVDGLRGGSAQQTLTALIEITSKLLSNSDSVGAVGCLGLPNSLFRMLEDCCNYSKSEEYVDNGAAISSIDLSSAAILINNLRTELSYSLHVILEWLTCINNSNNSCSLSSTEEDNCCDGTTHNARFISQYLTSLIVTRLSTNGDATEEEASIISNNNQDILGSAELILKYIRAVVYQDFVHKEFALTLQAKSIQGLVGGAQHNRYDSLSSRLMYQLHALDLLQLLATDSHYSSISNNTKGRVGGSEHTASPVVAHSIILKQCVQLIRLIERDYVWSEIIDVKNTTIDCSSTLEDPFAATGPWLAPDGTKVHRLPLSSLFKERMLLCLQAVLKAALMPSTESCSIVSSSDSIKNSINVWTGRMYKVHQLQEYLLDQVLASQEVDYLLLYGSQLDLSPESSILSLTEDNYQMSITRSTDAPFDSITSSKQHMLALLHQLSNSYNEFCIDTTDLSKVYGLFSYLKQQLHAEKCLPPNGSSCVAYQDVIALVDDILSSHLHNHSLNLLSSTGAPLYNQPASAVNNNLALIRSVADGSTASSSSSSVNVVSNDNAAATDCSRYLTSAVISPKDKSWVQISGSADVLTVHAYYDYDIFNNTATVHVRIFNSSGFKIPIFALHLVISSNLLSCDRTKSMMNPAVAAAATDSLPVHSSNGATLLSTTAGVLSDLFDVTLQSTSDGFIAPSLSAVLDDSSNDSIDGTSACCPITTLSAKGVEFFLPDEYLEREFSFHLQHFAPLEAVIRIVYPDLVYDEDDIFEIPDFINISGVNSKEVEKRHRLVEQQQQHDRYLDDFNKSSASNHWAAVLDCCPLHIPISSMLLPYGQGIYSAAQYWRYQGYTDMKFDYNSIAGIPCDVFQCMWRRLGGRYECAVQVCGEVSLETKISSTGTCFDLQVAVARQLRQAVHNITSSGDTSSGSHVLGTDCMVQPQQHQLSSIVLPISSSFSNMDLVTSDAAVAWCIQTAWGSELALKLVMEPAADVIASKDDSFMQTHWCGKLVCRCIDDATLQAFLADQNHFAYALSGGSFVVTMQ